MDYPIELAAEDDGSVTVTFPDVPEAISWGEDEADALLRARDALETALTFYMDRRAPLPAAAAAAGRRTVAPSLLVAMKLRVYEAMIVRGWRKAELARAMRLSPRQIERLFDINVATTVKQLEDALAALGRGARVETVELAA